MKIERFTKESILFLVMKAQEEIKKKLDSELVLEELNFHQAMIIIGLYVEKIELNPSHFISSLSVSKSIVSQSLTRLEERKLIKRTVHQEDARKTKITLTSKGKSKAPSLIKILDELDREVEKMLNTQNLKKVKSELKLINWSLLR